MYAIINALPGAPLIYISALDPTIKALTQLYISLIIKYNDHRTIISAFNKL